MDDLTTQDYGMAEPERPDQPPLRIALLSYRSDPKVGGQGIYVDYAARALARRGHIVEVISGPPYPEIRTETYPEKGAIKLTYLPSLDLYAQPNNGHFSLRLKHLKSWSDTYEYFGHVSGKFVEPFTFMRRAAKYLKARRGQYDVVFDNQTLAYGLLDIRKAGFATVGAIHHPITRDLKLSLENEEKWQMRWLIRRWYTFLKMQKRVARKLDNIIVVSSSTRDDITTDFGVSSERVAVVPLGIDQDMFRPRANVTRNPNQLISAASADVPLKGQRYLVEAYAKLLETRPDLELTVIGKPRKGPTTEIAEKLGVKDRIRYIHDLTHDEMAEAYCSATIAVTPSLYEGFGFPAAEAMACGTPVVVTNGGALPEVVGDAGVIVETADSNALAAAIGDLLDDPARQAELSKAGIARSAELYHWDRVAASYERVFRQAIAQTC
ncbi:MAG: glycosyltransferase family 4 protein [Hyphomonadaceae bacterium]